MKSIRLFYSLALITLFISSCDLDVFKPCIEGKGAKETAIFDVDPIVGFEINTAADVYIIDGDEQYVEITAAPNLLDRIEDDMRVRDGILEIGIDGCTNILRHEIEVVITVPGLERIGVNGVADITNEDTLFNTSEDIRIICNGTADIELDFTELNSLDVKISGSADLEFTGTVEDFDIDISGSGDVDCFELISADCNIDISGSADCEVYAESVLIVDINGSGDICYKGNPTVESSISGTGEVRKCF